MKANPAWPRRVWRRRGPFGKLVLLLVLALVPAGVFVAGAFAVTYLNSKTSNVGELAFDNPVAVPPVLEPRVDADGRKHFDLRLQTGRSELLPGRSTETWGVNGAYLGPTIRARTGDDVTMHVRNDLPEASSLHWHGMRLPAKMDGGPHQEVAPGATWSPHWTVKQPAASLWYHPHPHGKTAKHVYRGVSGMFLVDDAESDGLELPDEYGVDDIPLVIQDKKFTEDGELASGNESILDESVSGETGILGDTILVNGTHDPHFQASRTLTRLRVLNGSPARIYNLGFDDGRSFRVIGTDSGLLPAPQERERVVVSPGERVELLVRLEPGESPVLRSFPGGVGAGFPQDRLSGGDDTFDLIQLRAPTTLEPSQDIPEKLAEGERLTAPPDARVREFKLGGTSRINGERMDMARIDEVVPAGAIEVWEVRGGGNPHSFHIHDVAFRILDIDGEPPPAWLAGRKDTVYLPPGKRVRLVVEFGTDVDPEVPYMYHCHLLYHEDNGMMGQFVIVEPGREDEVPRTLDMDGHHHGHG